MSQTPAKPGWVYILTNEAMPGLVKIGLTTRTPKERAAELSGASGVPLPFVVAWAQAVPDCATVEKTVHRMLDDRRANASRESFRCDVATARQVIEAGAGSMLGRSYRAGPVRPSARRKGMGRRRRKDLSGFGLAVAVLSMAAVLALSRRGFLVLASALAFLPRRARPAVTALPSQPWRVPRHFPFSPDHPLRDVELTMRPKLLPPPRRHIHISPERL